MPLDFPSGPAINDTWTGANGVTYVFDGQKWAVSGSGGAVAYLPLVGGTMTGPITLAADPITDPQAANKHYVDASINLAGNYLGTWAVASNTPNISAGGSISNANYIATTVVAGTPETVPVGVPGIAGMTVANGDRVIWASSLGVWQILRNAGVTLAAADARYYAITNPSGYQTAAQVTTALAPYALTASVPAASSTTPAMDGTATIGSGTTWARADHIHPTDTSRYAASNPSGYQTAAQVQAAITAADDNVNYVDNSGFTISQRAYTTGTALTAGAYGFDRWKAGTGGCTLTFGAVSVARVVTITAGTLQQVVDGAELLTGSYTLSWTGTAQGRIGAGSYAASPVAVSATAGTNLTVEFNTGTLSRVRLEIGTVATSWQPRPSSQEWMACQRFYWVGQIVAQGVSTIAYAAAASLTMPIVPRAIPTLAVTTNADSGLTSPSQAYLQGGIISFSGSTPASSTGWTINRIFTASAEL